MENKLGRGGEVAMHMESKRERDMETRGGEEKKRVRRIGEGMRGEEKRGEEI